MTTWAIGDIHGCWLTLQDLLEQIEWEAERDELWLVGDLVNRGPSSLEVLRWAHEHRSMLKIVLGNHDLHLLARAAGVAAAKSDDTLDEVLAAPDREELLVWLRARPLLHAEGLFVLVHAGLVPEWNTATSLRLASLVSEHLSNSRSREFLDSVSRGRNSLWRRDLKGEEEAAPAAAIFTRIRMVDEDGLPRLEFQGGPEAAPKRWRPWFESSEVRRQGSTVVFGHWALHGFFRGPGVICLDSGCVYGGQLSAVCLEDGRAVQVARVD